MRNKAIHGAFGQHKHEGCDQQVTWGKQRQRQIGETWILTKTTQNTVNTAILATRSKQKHVNTVVLGFRGANNIDIYGVVCSQSMKKLRKHHLFGDFRPLWGWEKNCRGNNNNSSNKKKEKKKEKKKKQKNKNKHKDKKNKHKNATTRCVVRWLQAVAWKEHHTVLCTCAHAQSTWTTPTLTLLCITLMASPVCDTLQ